MLGQTQYTVIDLPFADVGGDFKMGSTILMVSVT
jgi:hypothetical protein